MDLDPCLDDLTEEHLEVYARLLVRRAGMQGSVGGKDASDYIQEAVRKVLAGERSLQPDLDLQENLIRSGQRLVWNERKKHAETPLEDLDEKHRDTRAFVERLVRQIDRRESIKPGHIGRLLGWKPERAYVAWRKVKAVVRDHLERTEP